MRRMARLGSDLQKIDHTEICRANGNNKYRCPALGQLLRLPIHCELQSGLTSPCADRSSLDSAKQRDYTGLHVWCGAR